MAKALTIGSCILTVLLGIQFVRSEAYNLRLQAVQTMETQRLALLQDQLRDYEFKVLEYENRTYDDGYRDALIRSNAGTFADGYEASKMIYENKSYVDGYHNCLKQFGYVLPVDLNKKLIDQTVGSN